MNELQTVLSSALSQNAQEILISPSQPLRLRIGRELRNLDSRFSSSHESQNIVSEILNDEEKRALFQNLKVEGVRTIDQVEFKFDFQIDFNGISGAVRIADHDVSWGLPAIVSELMDRPMGLGLIVGPRRSGKTTAVADLLKTLKPEKKIVSVYSDIQFDMNSNLDERTHLFSSAQLKTNGVFSASDVVVIDSKDLSLIENAIQLSEEGRFVLLTISAWDLKMALPRMLDFVQGDMQSRARRLAAVFQMAVRLQLLPGIEQNQVGAFELLLGADAVRENIEKQNFSNLDHLMQGFSDKTGMRNMNQSLFQLLIKRKIELKTAFEFSPHPQELDALLKKVGI